MEKGNKKRVIIFSTAYFPLVGGAEIAVKEIADRLGDEFDFVMVTARIRKDLPSYEKVGKVNVYRVGFGSNWDKYLLPFLGVFRALRAIKEGNGEKPLIWAIMASYGGLGALFLKVLRPKWPFLLTLQEGDSEGHILRRVGIFYPLWRQIFRRADYAQAISNYLADFARRQGARCEVEVVGNGVDLDKFSIFNFQFSINEKEILKEKLGIKEGEKMVVTVSRLVKKNGVDVLIEAMNELRKMDSRSVIGNDRVVKLVIVGEGEERRNLEKLIKDLKLEERVIFVGEVEPEKVGEYYAAADVFVRLSRSEGFGNVFIEAMAAGVPVVATNVGGIKDFARDGENCLLVGPEDAEGAAEAIKKILIDKELAGRLKEGGLKTAEKYDWQEIAGRMRKVFDKVSVSKKRERRIMIATGIWPPEAGGPATYAKEVSKRLIEREWRVGVVTYGDGVINKILNSKSETLNKSKILNSKFQTGKDGLEVIAVNRNLPRVVRYGVYFWKVLMGSFGAEAIYALDATAAGAPAAVAAMILRKKLVVRVGGDLLWERAAESGVFSESMDDFYESGFYRSFRPLIFRTVRFVLRRAETIFVTAAVLREVYVKYYGIPKEKIKILPNVFEGKKESRENTLEPKNLKTILFAGRFVRYKNLERLIEVVKKIKGIDSRFRGNDIEKSGNDRKIKLIIVGEGPEREALESKVESLDLKDKVEIRETVSREELKKMVAEADLGVALAWTEYNPNFILECLTEGVPVLVSRENGLSVKLPEMFLADPFSEKEIGEKMMKILTEQQGARAVAEKLSFNYSWKDSLNDLLGIL